MSNRKLKLKRALAIIDLETTGIWPDVDRIVEIAILKVHPDGSLEKYHERINPDMSIPAEATAVHGIADKHVKDSPSFAKLAKAIANFLAGCDLAGFNLIRFDLPLIESEFARAGISFSRDHRFVIDACKIFHLKEPRHLAAAHKFF